MSITIQQKGDDVSRRNFRLKNGFYENSAYNDGGVPHHYIIVAWFQDENSSSQIFPKIQAYRDKFYPNFKDGQYFIVLGDTDDDESYFESGETPENFILHLQELAIKLAEEKGLVPEYTVLDIFENRYNVTLYGYREGRYII